MPIEVTYGADRKLFRPIATEDLSIPEFAPTYAIPLAHPSFTPGANTLWDMENATLRLFRADVRRWSPP